MEGSGVVVMRSSSGCRGVTLSNVTLSHQSLVLGRPRMRIWVSRSLSGPDSWLTTSLPLLHHISGHTFTMSAEPLPTIRGPYQHYAERSFDWAPIFTARDHDQPTPSYRALEAKYGPPASTIRSHYRRFKAAQADKDDTGLRVALSEIDGRRDNARVFSREEETALRRVALKENAHPNKPRHTSRRSVHPPTEAFTGRTLRCYPLSTQARATFLRWQRLRAAIQARARLERPQAQGHKEIQAQGRAHTRTPSR